MLAINRTKDAGRRPKLKAPPNTCDTHSHIYGPQDLYPHVEGRESRFAPLEVYRAMLERTGLERSGIRGIKISHSGDELNLETARDIARIIEPFGWILQIQGSRDRWIENAISSLSNLPVPLIFDHIGRTPTGSGANSAEFKAILKLVETGNVWVKISGVYYSSKSAPSRFEDAAERIKILVEARPDRLLWALN